MSQPYFYASSVSKYLSDPTEDVRVATEAILSDFLREIRDITVVSKRAELQATSKRDVEEVDKFQENTSMSERAEFIPEHDDSDQEASYREDFNSDTEYRDVGGEVLFIACTPVLESHT